jgi:pimeloyl-ACP methyl ester carboxylesterase
VSIPLSSADRFSTPDAFISIAGGRLATWRVGSGPDLVAVHGWPLTAATWRNLLPALSRHFTVHLLDLPGSGRTEWPGPVDFEVCTEAVRAFVGALGLQSYGVLAHDSGAAIARLASAGDPRVRALVLGNTEIPGHHPPLLAAYVLAARAGLAPLVFRLLAWRPFRESPFGLGPLFTNLSYIDGEFAQLFLAPLGDPAVLEGQLKLLRAVDFGLVDALAEVHRRIQAPVLCVWGPDDPFFPVKKARRMLPQFGGGAELVEIPGGRLFAHEDHAEEFAELAIPFLQRHLIPAGLGQARNGGTARTG